MFCNGFFTFDNFCNGFLFRNDFFPFWVWLNLTTWYLGFPKSQSDNFKQSSNLHQSGLDLAKPTARRDCTSRPGSSRAGGNVPSAHAFVRDARAVRAPIDLVLGVVQPTQQSFSVFKCLRQWMTTHVLAKVRPADGTTEYGRERFEKRFPRTSLLRHLPARKLGVVVALATVRKVGGEEKQGVPRASPPMLLVMRVPTAVQLRRRRRPTTTCVRMRHEYVWAA